MKKIVYAFVIALFVCTSCTQDDAIIDPALKHNLDQVTVVGQNDPLNDPAAVQDAVDNHDVVVLSGTFDFGLDAAIGGVGITRPNVTLKGPATIVNGGKVTTIESIGTLPSPISIHASGVQVRGLNFSDNSFGILVDVQEGGRPVIIADNTMVSSVATILVSNTECGIKVLRNDLEGVFGYYGQFTSGYTAINNNDINAFQDGISLLDFDHRVYILNNNITMSPTSYTGIWIGAWQVTEESGPEWGNNPPVRIIGNQIELTGLGPAGIGLGTSAHGINNTIVRNNTIFGEAGYSGLLKEPYGHHNIFMNNDLSQLTTYSPQIWVHGGHHNHYRNNKLGPVEPFWITDWGPAVRSAATLVSTVNWHYQDNWLNTPDPVNHTNFFSHNDYRQTGVPGWSEDPEAIGGVLLIDFLQRFGENFEILEPLPYNMRNFINERKFPQGTTLCDQILDLSNLQGDDMVPGTNHIAGWLACEWRASRATYKSVKTAYQGFGKTLQQRHLKRMKARDKKLKELGLPGIANQ